jgi:hypothetical protein
VRIHTDTVARADSRLSYGFVAGPGTYQTTLTRPDLFDDYYREQFGLLLANHGVPLEIGTSIQPIPVHFALGEHDHLEGTLSAERRLLLRDLLNPIRSRCSPPPASITPCTACATTPERCRGISRTSSCSPTTSSTSTSSSGSAMN